MWRDSPNVCGRTPFHYVPQSSGFIPTYPGPTVTKRKNPGGRERPPHVGACWSRVWAPAVPPPIPARGSLPSDLSLREGSDADRKWSRETLGPARRPDRRSGLL